MKKIFKKIVAVAFILITAVMLCGCGASVECYYYSDSLGTSYRYRLVIPTALKQNIESSAKTRANGTTKYTFDSYLGELAKVRGLTYEASFVDGANTVYSLYLFVEHNTDNEDSNGEQESSGSGPVDFEWGFFSHKYTYKMANPFNGLYDEYTNSPAEGGLMYVLKYGYKEDLPALTEVFPAIKSQDMTAMGLDFYWFDSKMVAVNGETYGTGSNKYSYWQGKFDSEYRYLEFNYFTPNPLGWYVVILAVSVALIVILFIATRKSKAKPKMKKLTPMRTPYDTSPKIIYIRKPDVKPDIYGLDGNPVNPYETPEQKARRELEDIFMGRSDGDGDKKD